MHCVFLCELLPVYRLAWCSKCALSTAALVLDTAMLDIAVLREENLVLAMQNSLIALFLGLPADAAPPTDTSEDDAASTTSLCLDHVEKRPKRQRPARKKTTPTPPCYEKNPMHAFEKYGFSLPSNAEEALLIMLCVSELDFRRAARILCISLLFPSRIERTEAIPKLDAFLAEHGATRYSDVMRMSLLKYLDELDATQHGHM